MNLNHIRLTANIVADLYPVALIDDEKAGTQTKSGELDEEMTGAAWTGSETVTWKSLGENRKNILVIVRNQDAVYLSDQELIFLTGILTACKLSLADVAIVNLQSYPDGTYKELTAFFKSKIVLLFDTGPAAFGLPMSFPHYQIQAFAGNSFLYAPSLEQLENDRVEKSKLWACLKRLFNL